jgi:hypothetical protein
VRFAVDLHENFVEVSAPAARSHPQTPTFADLSGKQRAKSVPPKPNRLIANLDPPFVQQILLVAKREWELHVHHHRQTDDIWGCFKVAERAVFFFIRNRYGTSLPASSQFLLTLPTRARRSLLLPPVSWVLSSPGYED